MTALLGERARRDVWAGPIVDVDVHATPQSVETLMPYLEPVWRQHVRDRQWAGPSDAYTYPPGHPATARAEWTPGAGRKPASELSLVQEHVLDAFELDAGILNCYLPIEIGHPDVALGFAAAVNDWLIGEWLDVDDRLRASMVVPGDPAGMVKEIERVGDHPGFVQVLLPVRRGIGYGNRVFHAAYEAMTRHDLVFGLHWGGLNEGAPPTPTGWPSWYVEEYVSELQLFEAQVMNLIAEGVFKTFPALRVTVLEIGFAWLPTWGWRMNKEWKGMRREIPWIDRPPMDIIREHMRFSTAPLDAPDRDELARVIGWLGSEDLLLFATDYPHRHDDDLGLLLDAAPESMRPRIMAESARDWYRL